MSAVWDHPIEDVSPGERVLNLSDEIFASEALQRQQRVMSRMTFILLRFANFCQERSRFFVVHV